MPEKIPIENLLIDSGYLTRSQLDRAMRLKQGRPECSIEEMCAQQGGSRSRERRDETRHYLGR
ncbi:MAG: hypothetical protein ACLTAC_35005 [Hungatella sp.]